MAILKDFRQTKKINLPSYKDSEVEIYNSVLAKDADVFLQLQEKENKQDVQLMIKSLTKLIKSWNFTDDKNEVLPITEDNVGLIEIEDLAYIAEQVQEFKNELKKN